MAKLTWGVVGERFYEAGVDYGVLYLDGAGVAWNGLINVTERKVGDGIRSYHLDGVKYLARSSTEDFEGSIEAYTYPDEFSRCDGMAEDDAGILYDTQYRKSFGLSYRTKVGNDLDGPDYAYKIHLIYNALAEPSDRAHLTLSDSPEATTFSWDISATPVAIPGRKPTAHVVLDSRKVPPELLTLLEAILHGSNDGDARLPLPSEITTIANSFALRQDLSDPGTYFILNDALVEDVSDPGTYLIQKPLLREDPADPGTYLNGAQQ